MAELDPGRITAVVMPSTAPVVGAVPPAAADAVVLPVPGIPGPASTVPGPSAYDIAVADGFEGTVEEWLESLVGYGIDPTELEALKADVLGSSAATPKALARRDTGGASAFSRVYIGNAPTAANDGTRKDYVDAKHRRIARAVNLPSKTLELDDEGTMLYNSTASGAAETVIPLHANVPIPVGSWVDVMRGNTETATILRETGVILIGPDGRSYGTLGVQIRSRYGTVRLYKYATNSWIISGDIATVTDETVAAATGDATPNAVVRRYSTGAANFTKVFSSEAPSAPAELTRKDYVDAREAAHINSVTPHPAYDDLPDFVLLLENGMT